ncbi:hypothetical protein Q7P37_010603 [Cladosporium fusiforme]
MALPDSDTLQDSLGQTNHNDHSTVASNDTVALPVNVVAPFMRLDPEARHMIFDLVDRSVQRLAFQMDLRRGETPKVKSAIKSPLGRVCSKFNSEMKMLGESQLQKHIFGRGKLESFLYACSEVILEMQRLPGPTCYSNGLRKLRSLTVKFKMTKNTQIQTSALHFVFDDSEVDESLLSTFRHRTSDNEPIWTKPLPDQGQIEAFDEAVTIAKQANWKTSAVQHYQLWYYARKTFEKVMIGFIRERVDSSRDDPERFLLRRFPVARNY